MRLARKLSFALFLCVLGVLAVDAYIKIRREVSLFDNDVQSDHQRMARILQPSLAETWRREGEDRVLEVVKLTDAERARIDLRWVWLDASSSERAPLLPVAELAPLLRGQMVQVTREMPALGEGYFLMTYLPVIQRQSRVGALEIGESLSQKTSYLRTTMLNAIATTIAIAILCGVVAMALGRWFVGKPVTMLINKARRVGTGDLSGPLNLPRTDELGDLANEFNMMCDRLATALEQVRHADRLATIGTLTSTIAHEIGTPLNVVSGHARLIARGRITGSDAMESAQVMHEQCGRIAKIVRQVLEYGRRREPKRTTLDVLGVLRATVALLQPLATKCGVTLELSVSPTASIQTAVDAAQMQQALTNLIMNAIQASTEGQTVRVTAETKSDGANGDETGGRYHVISIEDSGSGISEEVRQRMFEPFFTTKDVGQGTGLGLSIARDIIVEHGGFIDVSTELGSGSCFVVRLPVRAS
jgi:two-component system NtrC family sensor kinase